jgi:hypothetical protein
MRRFLASCSVVLVAIALLGACGGSSSKAGSPSDTKADNSSNDGNGSSDSDFAKLVADASKARFKITYTTGSGSDEQTYAQDGKGTIVYGSADSQYFTSDDGSVACNTDSDGKATCTKVSGGSSISPFLTLFQSGKAAIDALGGRYGDVSSKTIAGRDAECLSITVAASATYCIDKETGVLLELSAKSASGKQESSFTVTKFEEPSDSDFTPPATPETIPSVSIPTITYPPGYTGPTIPGNG